MGSCRANSHVATEVLTPQQEDPNINVGTQMALRMEAEQVMRRVEALDLRIQGPSLPESESRTTRSVADIREQTTSALREILNDIVRVTRLEDDRAEDKTDSLSPQPFNSETHSAPSVNDLCAEWRLVAEQALRRLSDTFRQLKQGRVTFANCSADRVGSPTIALDSASQQERMALAESRLAEATIRSKDAESRLSSTVATSARMILDWEAVVDEYETTMAKLESESAELKVKLRLAEQAAREKDFRIHLAVGNTTDDSEAERLTQKVEDLSRALVDRDREFAKLRAEHGRYLAHDADTERNAADVKSRADVQNALAVQNAKIEKLTADLEAANCDLNKLRAIKIQPPQHSLVEAASATPPHLRNEAVHRQILVDADQLQLEPPGRAEQASSEKALQQDVSIKAGPATTDAVLTIRPEAGPAMPAGQALHAGEEKRRLHNRQLEIACVDLEQTRQQRDQARQQLLELREQIKEQSSVKVVGEVRLQLAEQDRGKATAAVESHGVISAFSSLDVASAAAAHCAVSTALSALDASSTASSAAAWGVDVLKRVALPFFAAKGSAPKQYAAERALETTQGSDDLYREHVFLEESRLRLVQREKDESAATGACSAQFLAAQAMLADGATGFDNAKSTVLQQSSALQDRNSVTQPPKEHQLSEPIATGSYARLKAERDELLEEIERLKRAAAKKVQRAQATAEVRRRELIEAQEGEQQLVRTLATMSERGEWDGAQIEDAIRLRQQAADLRASKRLRELEQDYARANYQQNAATDRQCSSRLFEVLNSGVEEEQDRADDARPCIRMRKSLADYARRTRSARARDSIDVELDAVAFRASDTGDDMRVNTSVAPSLIIDRRDTAPNEARGPCVPRVQSKANSELPFEQIGSTACDWESIDEQQQFEKVPSPSKTPPKNQGVSKTADCVLCHAKDELQINGSSESQLMLQTHEPERMRDVACKMRDGVVSQAEGGSRDESSREAPKAKLDVKTPEMALRSRVAWESALEEVAIKYPLLSALLNAYIDATTANNKARCREVIETLARAEMHDLSSVLATLREARWKTRASEREWHEANEFAQSDLNSGLVDGRGTWLPAAPARSASDGTRESVIATVLASMEVIDLQAHADFIRSETLAQKNAAPVNFRHLARQHAALRDAVKARGGWAAAFFRNEGRPYMEMDLSAWPVEERAEMSRLQVMSLKAQLDELHSKHIQLQLNSRKLTDHPNVLSPEGTRSNNALDCQQRTPANPAVPTAAGCDCEMPRFDSAVAGIDDFSRASCAEQNSFKASAVGNFAVSESAMASVVREASANVVVAVSDRIVDNGHASIKTLRHLRLDRDSLEARAAAPEAILANPDTITRADTAEDRDRLKLLGNEAHRLNKERARLRFELFQHEKALRDVDQELQTGLKRDKTMVTALDKSKELPSTGVSSLQPTLAGTQPHVNAALSTASEMSWHKQGHVKSSESIIKVNESSQRKKRQEVERRVSDHTFDGNDALDGAISGTLYIGNMRPRAGKQEWLENSANLTFSISRGEKEASARATLCRRQSKLESRLTKIDGRLDEVNHARLRLLRVIEAQTWCYHDPQVVFNGKPYESIVAWARAQQLPRLDHKSDSAPLGTHAPHFLRCTLLDLLPPIVPPKATAMPPAKIVEPGYIGRCPAGHLAYCHASDIDKRPTVAEYAAHPETADGYAVRDGRPLKSASFSFSVTDVSVKRSKPSFSWTDFIVSQCNRTALSSISDTSRQECPKRVRTSWLASNHLNNTRDNRPDADLIVLPRSRFVHDDDVSTLTLPMLPSMPPATVSLGLPDCGEPVSPIRRRNSSTKSILSRSYGPSRDLRVTNACDDRNTYSTQAPKWKPNGLPRTIAVANATRPLTGAARDKRISRAAPVACLEMKRPHNRTSHAAALKKNM